MARMENKVLLEIKEQQVLKVPKVPLELKGLVDLLDHKDPQELKVEQDRQKLQMHLINHKDL